jgi:hypothetical protein
LLRGLLDQRAPELHPIFRARILGEAAGNPLALVELARTETPDFDPPNAARIDWLRQMVTGNVWCESGAARTFVTIAEQMRDGGEADMALRSLVPIAHRCWWTRTRSRTRQDLGSHVPTLSQPSVVLDVIRAAATSVLQTAAA